MSQVHILSLSKLPLVAGVFQAIVAFSANLFLVRLLEPESFGMYALLLATIGIVQTIFSLRLNLQIIRYPEERFSGEIKKMYFSAIVYEAVFLSALLMGTLMWFLELNETSFFITINIISLHIINNLKAFYERTLDYKRLSIIEMLAQFTGHIISIILAVAGAGIAALYLRDFVIIIINILGLFFLNGLYVVRPRILKLNNMIHIIKNGAGIWLDSALEGGFARLNLLIAGVIGGERGAGLYFQAQRLAFVPHQLVTPMVNRVAVNWFSRFDGEEGLSGERKLIINITGIFSFSIALVVLVSSDYVIPFIFGEKWRDVSPILKSLSIFIAFVSISEIVKNFMIARHLNRVLIMMRLLQYAGLLLIIGIYHLLGDVNIISVSLGYSFAYLCSFFFGYGFLWMRDEKSNNHS